MRCDLLKIICVLTATALIAFSGCDAKENNDEKGRDMVFNASLDGSPATLDPQTSKQDSAVQIIACVFQGLFRFSDGGELLPAMAEKYTVSDDGLVWDFTLKNDVYWYGKDDFKAECTAEDYVFAFRRLMNPTLRSANAPEYYCIENAENINKGIIPVQKALGVSAASKYELRIKLCEPCPKLPFLLAKPAAMPCNEEFFNKTQGQYGLVEDCVASNGDFYLNKWFYDKWVKTGNFITLRRNPLNGKDSPPAPFGIRFDINIEEYSSFRSSDIHTYVTADPDEISELSPAHPFSVYDNSVWGITYNCTGVFFSRDLRIALSGVIGESSNSEVYSPAGCIVPENAEIQGENYRQTAGNAVMPSLSKEELLGRFMSAQKEAPEGSL